MMMYIIAAIVIVISFLLGKFGIRGFVVGILNNYRKFNLWIMRLRGVTVSSEAERRLIMGQAWEQWCDTLKAAGGVLLSPGCPRDGFNQAEGYRYLSRLVRVSLEAFMECTDPECPKLMALANGYLDAPVKLGSDNPDNYYQSAVIHGTKTYKLSVKRGTVHYLGFGTQAGSYGAAGGLKTVDYKEISDFEPDAQGNYEIWVGPEQPAGAKNYLRTLVDPEDAMLLVRQTREDHKNEILATVEIICTSGGGSNTPTPCSALRVEKALQTSGTFVAGASFMFARMANKLQNHVNQLPLFDQTTSNNMGGDPGIRYYHSYWRLEPHEALVIQVTPPKVETWNFQLNNHWMESLDYRYYPIHVNRHTALYHDDGKVVIVVAAENPNIAKVNWINTCGHRCGTMCFRWVRPDVEDELRDLPQPMCQVIDVIKVSKLRL